MACAPRGSLITVTWQSQGQPPAGPARPLFATNDNGDIDYRAVAAAALRLWRDYGTGAPGQAASRAQKAFWQGQMATCRWWHSVARALDRAMVAGAIIARAPRVNAAVTIPAHGVANA